jgi:hypothetical protein
MWKEFVSKLMMPGLRDSLNLILRYLLAQPVDIDIVVACHSFLQFSGISEFFSPIADVEDEEIISLPQLEPINKHQEF